LQFTIEARPLTKAYTHRPATEAEPRQTVVEAESADDAISRFVRDEESELVSFLQPVQGRESIATVKKNDSVYLVRVYAA
jgi:hypothetical protein